MTQTMIQQILTESRQDLYGGRAERAVTRLSDVVRSNPTTATYNLLAEAYCCINEPDCALVLLDLCSRAHLGNDETRGLQTLINCRVTGRRVSTAIHVTTVACRP